MAHTSIFVFLCFFAYVYFSFAENCDDKGILIYEDIKCKPTTEAKNSCPTKFDCDFSRPKTGCLFKGKHYQPQEEIESELTYSACQVGCKCVETTPLCAVLDCPEYLGFLKQPGCYFKYEPGKCCSTGSICDSNSTKTCEVDGQTYKIGQKFYPKNTCLRCVCHENFNGEFDSETCQRLNCAAELNDSESIRNKCAPAYFKFGSDETTLCCPNEWVCPESSDKIEVINAERKTNGEGECLFGSTTVSVGEGLKTTVDKYGSVRKLVCECVIPPLLTCKEI